MTHEAKAFVNKLSEQERRYFTAMTYIGYARQYLHRDGGAFARELIRRMWRKLEEGVCAHPYSMATTIKNILENNPEIETVDELLEALFDRKKRRAA